MRATPRLQRIPEGSILSIEQLNLLINRIEYGADVLRAYKTLAGTETTIEQQQYGRVVNAGSNGSNPLINTSVIINIFPPTFSPDGADCAIGQTNIGWTLSFASAVVQQLATVTVLIGNEVVSSGSAPTSTMNYSYNGFVYSDDPELLITIRVIYKGKIIGSASRSLKAPQPFAQVTINQGGTITIQGYVFFVTFSDYYGFDVCPRVGPPCGQDSNPSCQFFTTSGYITSSRSFSKPFWYNRSPVCILNQVGVDDMGTIGGVQFTQVGCNIARRTAFAECEYIDVGNDCRRIRVPYSIQNGIQGGPYGINQASVGFYWA